MKRRDWLKLFGLTGVAGAAISEPERSGFWNGTPQEQPQWTRYVFDQEDGTRLMVTLELSTDGVTWHNVPGPAIVNSRNSR